MPKLSASQIRSYAASAGFTGDDLDIAVAVALAESGGNTTAHNSTPPDNSYGLWQINMLGGMGPERRKRYGLKSNDDLYDPAINARVAKGIHAGSGWKAWTTYTRGTYKKYLSDAKSAIGDAPATNSGGGGTPVLGVGAAINAFGKTIFDAFSNFAGIILATALILVGIIVLSRNVIPVGKVAKIAGKVAK